VVDRSDPTYETLIHSGSLERVTRILDRPWIVAGTLALVFGFLIAVFTPPLAGGDERDHFDRA
jgi:hypothetical protein